MSSTKLGNILIFYYYQNLYYDYVDSNKATENFKFLLSNDSSDEINIFNTLIDINNILDYKKIIVLFKYYFKYYNNNLALINVNNDYFTKILLHNNSKKFGSLDFQINHIPYYINWDTITPEILYKINNFNNANPKNNYIINFGPSIYDELSVVYKYIKYLTYNNVNNVNNFINNDMNVDMSNVTLFFLALDDPDELKYFINFGKAISNTIDIYQLKSIYNDISINNCIRINNNIDNSNPHNSLYNNYIQYIIANKMSINYINSLFSSIKINIITIPTAETSDEFDKTIIGEHIDKSLDILYNLYNSLSVIKQNNSFIYIKTFSKSSIEKLYSTLRNKKFIGITNKIILSSKNVYNNLIVENTNLNGLKNINSFNFNTTYVHNYIKNTIESNSQKLIYNKTFIDITEIENIYQYNLSYLNNLLINYLINSTKNSNKSTYKPINNYSNKYNLINEFINNFKFSSINNLITNLLDSSVLNKLNKTYIESRTSNNTTNNISNRYNYYTLFEYNNDASNSYYWENSINNNYFDSSLSLVNDLINSVYSNTIICNSINLNYRKNVVNEFSFNSLFLNKLSHIYDDTNNNNVLYNSLLDYPLNNYKLYLKLIYSDFSINDLSFTNNTNNTNITLTNNYQEVSLNNLQFKLTSINAAIQNLKLEAYIADNKTIKSIKSNNFTINIKFYNDIVFDLSGENPYYNQIGISFEDPGVNVYRYIINNNSVSIENVIYDSSSNVNYSISGDYSVTYYELSNNSNNIIRNVNVSNINNLKPRFIFSGNKVINHYKGLSISYIDLSALCYSYADSRYIDFSLNFNDSSLNILGTHIAYYYANDSMNNYASDIKIINVIDWIDLKLDYTLSNNSLTSNSTLTLHVENLGTKDGTGDLDGYDYIRFLEITKDFNNSFNPSNLFTLGENIIIEISNNKYYFVKEINLGNYIDFNTISLDSNTEYSLSDSYFSQGYLGIFPSIKAKESYTITLDISDLPKNKLYALLLDDGTYETYLQGDNVGEVIETFDNPSNNIAIIQL